MLVSNILKKEDSKELQTNQSDTGKVLQKIIKQLIGKRIENNTINRQTIFLLLSFLS